MQNTKSRGPQRGPPNLIFKLEPVQRFLPSFKHDLTLWLQLGRSESTIAVQAKKARRSTCFNDNAGFNCMPLKPHAARLTLCLLLAPLVASAIIGTPYQMQLGNPSGASADTNNHDHFLIQRTVEAIDYNDNLGEPNWASWDLTASDLGTNARSSFITDTNLPPNFNWVAPGDYTGSGYDRGHLCPSKDRTDTAADNDLVFLMSNVMPQNSINNSGVWLQFENYCRALAQTNELLIIWAERFWHRADQHERAGLYSRLRLENCGGCSTGERHGFEPH